MLKFSTTRSDFSKGQKVTLTYQRISKGTLVKARFSCLENVVVNRRHIKGKQKRTRSRSFRQLLAGVLSEFRDGLGKWKVGMGCRSGRILLEGHVIEVDAEKLSWFRTPDGQYHTFGLGVAAWIESRMEEPL